MNAKHETRNQETDDLIEARRAGAEVEAPDLDHEEWERAAAARITRYWSGEEAPPGRHAEARVLWTEGALAVRFTCRQSEPLVVGAEPRVDRKTLGLWDRDVCEVFVAPGAGAVERYFEFEAAPTGEWVDLAISVLPGGRRETEWDYRSGMTAAARVSEGAVTIAMRVPWGAFGRGAPRAGEVWRANLFRCVGAGDPPARGYLAWQPTLTAQPNFHVPEKFGRLRFSG